MFVNKPVTLKLVAVVAVPLAGGVAEVVTAYSYPPVGAGEGAVHETVAEVKVNGVPLGETGAKHAGGAVNDQAKVNVPASTATE